MGRTRFLLHVSLPIPLISLLMTMFKARFIFTVGRGVVKEVAVSPQSGVKQGGPLSAPKAISPQIRVLFYADDLLLYIPPPRPNMCPPAPPYLSSSGSLACLRDCC